MEMSKNNNNNATYPRFVFLFVLAEAKTAVYGLQEQKKKKNGRYF